MCPRQDFLAGFRRSIHRQRASGQVLFVFNMASVINLAAISLERTHATFRPFQHRVLKKWVFGAAVAAVWITAVLSASYIYLDVFFTLSGPGEFYSYLSILSFCFFVIAVSYASIVAKMLCHFVYLSLVSFLAFRSRAQISPQSDF